MQFNKLAFATILAAVTSALAQTQACCDSTTTAGAPGVATILSLAGIVAQGANVPIGLGCSPITVRILVRGRRSILIMNMHECSARRLSVSAELRAQPTPSPATSCLVSHFVFDSR